VGLGGATEAVTDEVTVREAVTTVEAVTGVNTTDDEVADGIMFLVCRV
jgi:hypothetical protein